jgi:hypothetical protein
MEVKRSTSFRISGVLAYFYYIGFRSFVSLFMGDF